MRILGIDLGRFNHPSAYCLIDTATGETHQATCSTTVPAILDLIRRLAPNETVVESCRGVGPIIDACREQNFPIVALSTNGAAHQNRAVKTDQRDAMLLAEIAWLKKENSYRPVHVPGLEIRARRGQLHRRERIISSRVAAQNGITNELENWHLVLPESGWNRDRLAAITKLGDGEHPAAPALRLLMDQLRFALAQETEINRAVRRSALADPIVQLLMTMPGVGWVTAEAFRVTIDDPRRFPNKTKLTGYLGFAPRVCNSGKTMRMGGLSKRGPCDLRRLLVSAAWTGRRCDDRIAERFERLRKDHVHLGKKAANATAAYMAKWLWYMWLKEIPWNELDDIESGEAG